MTDMMKLFLQGLLMQIPYLLLFWAVVNVNLKAEQRCKQFLMPILAAVFMLVLMFSVGPVSAWVHESLENTALWMQQKAEVLQQEGGLGAVFASVLGSLGSALASDLETNPELTVAVHFNWFVLLGYLIFKWSALSVLGRCIKTGNSFFEVIVMPFYELDEEDGQWYLLERMVQARTYLKTFLISLLVLSILLVDLSGNLLAMDRLAAPYCPVYALVIVAEIYCFLCGKTKREIHHRLYGERDQSEHVCDYSALRGVLRQLFGDKLTAEQTSANYLMMPLRSNTDLLRDMMESECKTEEIYGTFMQQQALRGTKLDQNYLLAGLDLLNGKSILFNNPFYCDLTPYVCYAVNRTILRQKKVLIVLGRHAIEDDVKRWCTDGLMQINNIADLWKIGVLGEETEELDIGIVARSSVHNQKMRQKNVEFFEQVDMVILIEPSKLLSTAQVGLRTLIQQCRPNGRNITFCSFDKNCDGLVDALSHVLLTSLTEVSATNHHAGLSSYMSWETDGEYLQHRLLPNLSRYLGYGTELSFVALKNQVEETIWYGGETFPVVDMHWIVKQYYFDLLRYANLPAGQETIDACFHVSANLWDAPKEKNRYMVVEDEDFNLFEAWRNFSTRATDQGFVNVISSDYLLRDYMADNESIFRADPKAIPYIVADYTRTLRNVTLRLCLQMSSGTVYEQTIAQELKLAGKAVQDVREDLWSEICACNQPAGVKYHRADGREVLRIDYQGQTLEFTSDVLCVSKKYSLDTGRIETSYSITDSLFKFVILRGLQSAAYISETEQENREYLGVEILDQIYQKHLPGQFFTFNGKYYEMLNITQDGQVLVRRAADHINGRPTYRQIRKYAVSGVVCSERMAAMRVISGLRLTELFGDIRVNTDGYWRMKKHNDFISGKRVEINGVPERCYHNKKILRLELLDLPEGSGKIYNTLGILFNEVFRTLFAENCSYIVALTAGQMAIPSTYSLEIENGQSDACIYILEDSQLDLGLLTAVERNLKRIMEIVSDYLTWHFKAVELSLNPPVKPEKPEAVTFEPIPVPEPKKGLIARIIARIKAIFKKKPVSGDAEQETPNGEATQPEAVPVPDEKPIPASDADQQTEAGAPVADENGEAQHTVAPDNETAPLLSRSKPMYSTMVEEHNVEFEADQAVMATTWPERRPYHLRHYLLYGQTQVPDCIDLDGLYRALENLGMTDNALRQAREGQNVAELIENSFVPNRKGAHYCDFCGAELVGTEYAVLADGRERCSLCSRTVIKNEEELCQMLEEILKHLRTFFGVQITAPISIQMVNAKRLHRKLNKRFVPTGGFDGRILGVAIKEGQKYTLLLENGSPRLSAMQTMVHELTHMWQYLNWNDAQIRQLYGDAYVLDVYEGMAKWCEVQYLYMINEPAAAKREEIITNLRNDEYGRGFRVYTQRYPLCEDGNLVNGTPFEDPQKPL